LESWVLIFKFVFVKDHCSNIIIGVIFICLTGFISCKKNTDPPPPNTNNISLNKLMGTWRWEMSYGGFSGEDTMTPSSTGYSEKRIYSSTNEMEIFRNDTLYSTSSYFVFIDTIILPDTFFNIYYSNFSLTDEDLWFSGYDTVLIYPKDWSDSFTSKYIRE
jgi:hypothetical protein